MTIASNVLRQMNSKMHGDLYNIKFQELMPSPMLIGIDVCHSGSQSIVGFCASTNKELSQYYSEKISQDRHKELVTAKLKEAMKHALDAYHAEQKAMPKHIILYRDGVGDTTKRHIIQKEVSQIKEALHEVFNKASVIPCITVIIVQKKITQRFFTVDSEGNY